MKLCKELLKKICLHEKKIKSHMTKGNNAQCSKTALPPTKSPRSATVSARKLKFGLKTP